MSVTPGRDSRSASLEAGKTEKTLLVTGYSLLVENLTPEVWDLNPV
jgi:hypothetical protein